ncbi:hypothetical protein RYX36_006017, partial [Vicia faba]
MVAFVKRWIGKTFYEDFGWKHGRFCKEVGPYISNSGDKNNVLLELCIEVKISCMMHPQGAKNELFCFYTGVKANFGVGIPFTVIKVK